LCVQIRGYWFVSLSTYLRGIGFCTVAHRYSQKHSSAAPPSLSLVFFGLATQFSYNQCLNFSLSPLPPPPSRLHKHCRLHSKGEIADEPLHFCPRPVAGGQSHQPQHRVRLRVGAFLHARRGGSRAPPGPHLQGISNTCIQYASFSMVNERTVHSVYYGLQRRNVKSLFVHNIAFPFFCFLTPYHESFLGCLVVNTIL